MTAQLEKFLETYLGFMRCHPLPQTARSLLPSLDYSLLACFWGALPGKGEEWPPAGSTAQP